MPTTKTTTAPEATGLDMEKVRNIAATLATATSIHQNTNTRGGVITDSREVALFVKLSYLLGAQALRQCEELLGERVDYDS